MSCAAACRELVAWAALWMLMASPSWASQEPLRVMAASSLTEAFQATAEAYAAQTGRPAPMASFAGSSRVSRQILEGAPADVVAVANPRWMNVLLTEGIVVAGTQSVLLENRLVFAVPSTSTATLDDISGLTDARWSRLAIAGPTVPAGQYAREALQRQGLTEALSSRLAIATNVRATLSLIALGEVDGGFVYQTDALAESRVRPILMVDPALHTPIEYPVALTQSGVKHPDAEPFLAYIRTAQGRAIFEAAGFTVPQEGQRRPAPESAEASGSGESTKDATLLSLWVAAISLILSIVPAVGLGWLLARREFWGKSFLSTLLMAPLVLPPVVTGYLLLRTFGRNGLMAPVLDAVGLEVAFTRWGAVVAAAVVGFPLLLILVRQAIESVDVRYPAIAQTLGMTPMRAFFRVTLPMALPGIAAGCVLAFARALGEFGATAMIAGNQPGETRTLALAVYALAEVPGGEDEAATLVWISLALCAVALLVYERLVWRQRRRVMEMR